MSTACSSIDIAELEKIVKPEKEQWEKRSIYKLPPSVMNINKDAYTPRIVSLGPYHYKDENLKQMIWHKQRALNQFLNRSDLTYDDCFRWLSEIVEELMNAYDWLDLQMDSNAFLPIMIRDGAFMLEIFSYYGDRSVTNYAPNDPIFSKHGELYVVPHVKKDMLMLDNQVPIKVLHRLYQLQFKKKDPNNWQEKDANKVVFQFFFSHNVKGRGKPPNNSLHVLDMYRAVMLGTNTPSDTEDKNKIRIGGENIIRSAVELTEAGIKIKKSKTSSIKDIRFEKGVLELPRIVVDDTTQSLFLNLIAYERFHVGAGNYVTAYAFLMDQIIDDARDIKLLHFNEIIQNGIGSDAEAAKLFNSLSRDVCLDETTRIAAILNDVNAYCKHKIPRHRASLQRNYFTSPWTAISLFGAILIFVLTVLQTIYTIKGFYKDDNNKKTGVKIGF